MKKQILLPLMASLFLLTCTPSPKDIDYGHDVCHYCKMTIMDAQHGAEAVTSKGKVYKFDAIECMVNYELENKDKEFAFLLVNDYNQPKKLIDARNSRFLVSKNLPSPMGAFLTAFENERFATEVKEKKGGNIYSWDNLKHNGIKGIKAD